jgi:hypothetical protein
MKSYSDCICTCSSFIYNLTGHVITDDLHVDNGKAKCRMVVSLNPLIGNITLKSYGFFRKLCQTI